MENVMNLLPIGSVIRLAGAKKSLMIHGVIQTDNETEKTYDYIGVLWPEGNLGDGSQVLFNHKDIEKVEFTGYTTDERQEFLNMLNDYFTSAR